MGEEVIAQLEVISAVGIDEADHHHRAVPAVVVVGEDEGDENCDRKQLIEKCEAIHVNCDDGDGSVIVASKQQAEKSSPKKVSTSVSFEKSSKKWYNISFMHRATTTASNSRSANNNINNCSSSNNPALKGNKMDNRHSWHLNDSLEM